MNKLGNKLGVVVGIIFFIVGLLTLPDYGINWDTINHLPRGQAYLHYYLTGENDYSNLDPFTKYHQDESTLAISPDSTLTNRRSLYQNDSVPYSWYMEYDGGGHPPASDIISSFFNYILYQKLGIINDIDSYRVYGVLLASALVSLLYYWVKGKTNALSALVASFSLALYPLFFAESHFNTEKDIPETVFWSFLLYCVWKGIIKKNPKLILLSGVFLGLALGTKFNVLFIVFVIVPWILFVLAKNNYGSSVKQLVKRIKTHKALLLSAMIAPILGIIIFVALWPYLWQDPIGALTGVVGFYKTIGTTTNFDIRYLGWGGMNTYPIQWIFYTTPIVILVLSGVGFVVSIVRLMRTHDNFYLLVLLWLMVPILRVSLPGSNIYGGVRQIMEYVPALAILAGVGAHYMVSTIGRKWKVSSTAVSLVVVLAFVPLVFTMWRIHPNQNVYFNPLIGGLEGAKKEDIPSWGNSFGAAYRQGVAWINENAESDAHVVYAHELIPNIPTIWWRQDLVVWNVYRSGFLQSGEYAITLTYDGTKSRSYYDAYLELFVEPSFTVDVDGVSILKVWHNTPENQKYSLTEKTEKVTYSKDKSSVVFDLGITESLKELQYQFDSSDCVDTTSAYVEVSVDGTAWTRLPGVLPSDWLIPFEEFGPQPNGTLMRHPFAGTIARYIRVNISPTDSCLWSPTSAEVTYYENIPSTLREDLTNLF